MVPLALRFSGLGLVNYALSLLRYDVQRTMMAFLGKDRTPESYTAWSGQP
jgi:hypothetical protein